ncbi:MAG: methyltransferase domain-containing protein [Clostridia bacterium]|nr:methyltransferase domain-containing protein [Clostridia bacterium]
MFEPVSITREIIGNGASLLLQGDGTGVLPPEVAAFEGKVQCVYVDPPFMTGGTFTRRRRFGQKGWKTGSPAPEYPAYDDRFASRQDYMAFLRGLLTNAHRLLSATGVMCLHLDWRASAYARVLCDEIFGEDRFLNEVIWAYESGGRAKRHFSRKHDVILIYAKSRKYRFDLTQVPLERGSVRRNHMRRQVDETGRVYRSIRSGGKEYRYYDDTPVYPGDVWTDISHLQQRDPERSGYATQKPLKLLDRLLRPVVKPGDIVCDLCCGSGTALAAAQALGCQVIGMDMSPEAVLITRSRLHLADMTIDCEDTPVAQLEGSYQPEDGVLLLTDFRAQHKSFPKTERAFDRLECWSAGYMLNGSMVTLQHFHRSPKHPELPLMCVLPENLPSLAVQTVDAAGRKTVFQWK